MDIELSLLDNRENIKAVAVFVRGISRMAEPDRAMLKFFQSAISELQRVINQRTP